MTCKAEEHQHTKGCLSDPEADLETAEIWEKTLPDPMPKEWREAVVAIAESQIGYTESSKNYIIDEEGNQKGYTRYSEWYGGWYSDKYGEWNGDAYGDWSAAFVSFCLHYAGVEDFPFDNSCQRWADILKTEEYDFYRTAESYQPKEGDLIFLDLDGDQIADQAGLAAELLEATETEPAGIRTIEGDRKNPEDPEDMEDGVRYVLYSQDDERIMGYGELPEQAVKYQWGQNGLEVTVSIIPEEDIPVNAELVVKQVLPGDKEETKETAEDAENARSMDGTESADSAENIDSLPGAGFNKNGDCYKRLFCHSGVPDEL